jgi:hypothetical protein
LVDDSTDHKTTKAQYALKHNIPIITSKQLKEMVGVREAQ